MEMKLCRRMRDSIPHFTDEALEIRFFFSALVRPFFEVFDMPIDVGFDAFEGCFLGGPLKLERFDFGVHRHWHQNLTAAAD